MKIPVSTNLEEGDFARIERLVKSDISSAAAILRKAIIKGLPILETEILGPQFAGKPARRNGKGVPA